MQRTVNKCGQEGQTPAPNYCSRSDTNQRFREKRFNPRRCSTFVRIEKACPRNTFVAPVKFDCIFKLAIVRRGLVESDERDLLGKTLYDGGLNECGALVAEDAAVSNRCRR